MLVQITKEIIQQAEKWSDFYGNEHTFNKDKNSKLAGYIAELMFSKAHPKAIRISDNDRQADFIIDGKRIDVKCKQRRVYCKPYYDVSIEDRQSDFDVDVYVFFSYNTDDMVLEYLGWITKEEYFSKARAYKKGELDESNNWVAACDCHNLQIQELYSTKYPNRS